MLFIGLISFLHGSMILLESDLVCFNALYRASSISTVAVLQETVLLVRFNALYRASSISTVTYEFNNFDGKMFQCPLSGFFHFYGDKLDLNTDYYKVSMPSIGLLPFL